MDNSFTFTMIGSYGGHNAGDDAILYSTIKSISSVIPDAKFFVLSNNPDIYEKDLKDFDVKFLKRSPTPKSDVPNIFRHSSMLQKAYRLRYGLSFFSYNLIYAIIKSDALIISGGVFFDYRLFHPARQRANKKVW